MVLFVVILIIILYVLKYIYPRFKGSVGEETVTVKLQELGDEYKVLNDLLIFSDNKTHQIDNVIVSKYGIFVIETKNYGGKIVGKEKDKEWRQYIGKRVNKLRNPIIQNHGHVLALKDITKLNENNFIPIVCFGDKVKLSLEVNSSVVKVNNLISTIENNKKIRLKNYEEIYRIIYESNIKDKKIRRKHNKNIKKNNK